MPVLEVTLECVELAGEYIQRGEHRNQPRTAGVPGDSGHRKIRSPAQQPEDGVELKILIIIAGML